MDDLARMAGSAVSLLSTMRQQIKTDLRDKVDTYTNRMDIAHQEELERLQAQVSKYRLEQEQMKAEIAALKSGGKTSAKAKPSAPAKKAGLSNSKPKPPSRTKRK